MVENVTILEGHSECQKKLDEYLAGWKRALADYQNLKKTVEDTKAMIGNWKDEAWILEWLPVVDHFRSAVRHLPAELKNQAWAQGFLHIEREVEELLRHHGVERFDSLGQQFDPVLHEAVKAEPSAEKPKGTVLEVSEAGYRMNGKVLRPAKVVVSE